LAAATLVYKLVPRPAWQQAEALGRFTGSAVDVADGFIHLSTAAQVEETAARHFAGAPDLLLVAVATADVSDRLRWEPSRGGALFPHLYGDLPLDAVRAVTALPVGANGRHEFPELSA
jgi:uncharacterized protein (DUF952 family)